MLHRLREKHRQSERVGKANRRERERLTDDTRKEDNENAQIYFSDTSSLNALSVSVRACFCLSDCIVSEASKREDSLNKVRGKFLKSTDGSSISLVKRSADFVKWD